MKKEKIQPYSLKAKKKSGERITMLTAYDYTTARILDEAGVDTILIGDSAANVVLGYSSTLPVTMDELMVLTRAVSRAVNRALVIGDMPFGSYNSSIEEAIKNATRFIKEAGADCVKLEGGGAVVDIVKRLVQAGIPTVGHLGLTPQTAGMIGGYRVQAKDAVSARQLIDDGMRLEDAGAFMLVVECIPEKVAELLCKKVEIPLIGIGAGAHCDGQVLVLHDMLGLYSDFTPKFVKKYASIGEEIQKAVKKYVKEVKEGDFPAKQHTFSINNEEIEKLKKLLQL